MLRFYCLFLWLSWCLLLFIQCDSGRVIEEQKKDEFLFELVSPAASNVWFRNQVTDTGEYTPFNTLYIYNGGGVAAGDLNNDGLPDLVFTANQSESKIYINKGDFKFDDITKASGFTPRYPWVTGVTLVDINSDGWLDIYVCRSGNEKTSDRSNELYINNKDLTFTERAEEYGLADPGSSTQAYFFDYDNDEDLDVFIVSHPAEFKRAVDFHYYFDYVKDTVNQDKLYRNDNGHFVEVTDEAGIRDDNGFGLSAVVIDVNNDGFQDIFVANDFFAPDRLYVNQGNGTFQEQSGKYFQKMSLFSMGSDQADYDLDGDYDLIVTDMAPPSMSTMKTHMFDLPIDWYLSNQRIFGVEQVTRNMLYSRSGDDYVDVGEMNGLSRTDWSWSVFIEDIRNREYPDILVANGLKRDFHDNDYSRKNFDDKDYHLFEGVPDAIKLVEKMPQRVLQNCFFTRDSTEPYVQSNDLFEGNYYNSQGAALADLDNDGDLDVVFNNTDSTAAIFRNLSENSVQSNFLRLALRSSVNTFCVGCEVKLFYGTKSKQKRLFPTRGFQSSSEPTLHFGLPNNLKKVDSLYVIWPGGRQSVHKDISVPKSILIVEPENLDLAKKPEKQTEQVVLLKASLVGVEYRDKKPEHLDFYQDKLNPFDLSSEGPVLCVGDFNQDGKEDLIVGSDFNEHATIFFQGDNKNFKASYPFQQDSAYQESVLVAVDIDSDGDLDIYAGSGGNMYEEGDYLYQDRIYLNNGVGEFTVCEECLPQNHSPTGTVQFQDLDGNGFLDAFVGARHVPHQYGKSPESFILMNHNGIFSEERSVKLGMVTDAEWFDIDGDNDMDLVVVGEWMSPQVLINNGSELEYRVQNYFPKGMSGLWRMVSVEDWNGDGEMDLLMGNQGLNSILAASEREPLKLYGGDFDNSGSYEPLVTHYIQGEEGFYASRTEFCLKMPKFNGVYRTNKEFAQATIDSVLKQGGELELVKEVQELRSGVLLTEPNGFVFNPFPGQMQAAPINEYCNLGHRYGIMSGNTVSNYYRQGSTIAFPVTLFERTENGMNKLSGKASEVSGMRAIPSMSEIMVGGEKHLIFGVTNDSLLIGRLNQLK